MSTNFELHECVIFVQPTKIKPSTVYDPCEKTFPIFLCIAWTLDLLQDQICCRKGTLLLLVSLIP